ncbi:M10 family metallopeptidase [Marinibacterium profundimaris]|uniref:M10 family metallopeptidase n=1 Tax=Marinibacterium profundimaris TaxID=1679460 RepID=UPI000B52214D|nr:M10 family metallopeptidase [Marinibacterium profundimaris]
MASVVRTAESSAPFGAWLYDYQWADPVLSFGFPDSAADFGYTDAASLSSLNWQQMQAARRALAQVESFTNLRFEESDSHTAATLRYVYDSAQATALAYFPYAGEEGGDGFFGYDTLNPVIGNYADFTFLHETGHMLGLEHAHEAAGFASGPLNSSEFTIMTYASFPGDRSTIYVGEPGGYAQGYMQLDIAALQFLYGANYAPRGEVWSGNTTYSFDPGSGEMFINGAGQGAPADNRIFRTIWDGHGKDTYDLSNYAGPLTIDLRAGNWSTFSEAQISDLDSSSGDPAREARGNLANARLVDGDLRALIENAIGGSGDDRIFGNQADNRVQGGSGRDTILGRGGDDLLHGQQDGDLLRGNGGNDSMSGGGGQDRLLGDDGADRLRGNGGADDLRGGRGADVLIGGPGQDLLRGHAGADRFQFNRVSDSPVDGANDRILDFRPGLDRIDLRKIADGLEVVIGRGLLRDGPSVATLETANGNTIVTVDADGDGRADMRLIALDATGLGIGDFMV